MASPVASISVCLLAVAMSMLIPDAVAQSTRSGAIDNGRVRFASGSGNKTRQFALEAQPLQTALESFGVLTGFAGLYSASTTDGRMSAPVFGVYTPEVALRLLIESTDLVVYFTALDAYVLEPGDVLPSLPVATDRKYDGLLQWKVRDALCSLLAVETEKVRVALQFHVDAKGRISRPFLLDTTGKRTRDQMILTALRQLDVGQVPLNTSEPFFMLILPEAFMPGGDCALR